MFNSSQSGFRRTFPFPFRKRPSAMSVKIPFEHDFSLATGRTITITTLYILPAEPDVGIPRPYVETFDYVDDPQSPWFGSLSSVEDAAVLEWLNDTASYQWEEYYYGR
jgi:hypothetical protein